MNHEFEKDPLLASDEEERFLVDNSLEKALFHLRLKRAEKRKKGVLKASKQLIQGRGKHL